MASPYPGDDFFTLARGRAFGGGIVLLRETALG
jgi:hypothetical protein